MKAINPTTTSAWTKLVELSKKNQTSTIAALFNQKDRFERYSRSLEDILVDFSKNRISDEVFEELLNLAQETALQEAINSMFEGKQSTKPRTVQFYIQPYVTAPIPRSLSMAKMSCLKSMPY